MPRHARTCARLAILLPLFASGACTDEEMSRTAAVGVMSVKPVMTRSEYMAMPHSTRLDVPGDDGSFGMERGVAVEVDVRLDGREGTGVPFAYALHHAGNGLPLRSVTVPLVPDAPRWHRRGHVWLAIPGPGSYYVRVTLNDSTSPSVLEARTADFTIP